MTELRYDFLAPGKLVFGWGRMQEAGQLARALGQRAFLISGSRSLERAGLLDRLRNGLELAGVQSVTLGTQQREPEVADVDRLAATLREYEPGDGDFLLALGGGSAIDLAKAVAAMATNQHGNSVQDFLEGVGCGLSLDQDPLPVMAMPTTAGTGTEATKNAVISSDAPPFKKSLRSDKLIPRLVLIDPELSVSVPPDTTAYTGMDAITQLLESYLSRRAQPIPQALCVQGLQLALPAIGPAVRDGGNRPAREQMAHAALLSGLALANSGLGMAHGVAAALGVHCRIPHGLACAVMLPETLRTNAEVCREPLRQLCAQLPGIRGPEHLVEWIEELCGEIGIPRRLSAVGVTPEQLPALVASSRGNSMSGNPRDLTDDELTSLLERML